MSIDGEKDWETAVEMSIVKYLTANQHSRVQLFWRGIGKLVVACSLNVGWQHGSLLCTHQASGAKYAV
jgi:hypothetical protein